MLNCTIQTLLDGHMTLTQYFSGDTILSME